MIESDYALKDNFWAWAQMHRPAGAAILRDANVTTAKLTAGGSRSALRFPLLIITIIPGSAAAGDFEQSVAHDDVCMIIDGHPDDLKGADDGAVGHNFLR